jgi:GT2 family glycosyltransferase
MKLSVVIPTHNRAETLGNTLAALTRQSLGPSEFELLVVDDGSDATHRARVRDLRERFGFELVEKDQGGLASARNSGARRARGEILHFLDDDVIPAPDSLAQHLASHAAAGAPVAVVGALPFPPHVRLDAFLWYIEHSGHYDLYRHPRKYPGGQPPMPPMNGNSSIPRELFFRVGAYDESFRQYGSEDLELGYRLALAGVRFVYNPRAVGFHDHTKDFPRFCADMEIAGASLIRVYRKYPEIKAPKKIDLVEDGWRDLAPRKWPVKLVMETTFRMPWILAVPRRIVAHAGRHFALRHLLFPLYRWVAHYHYAAGMRRALAQAPAARHP